MERAAGPVLRAGPLLLALMGTEANACMVTALDHWELNAKPDPVVLALTIPCILFPRGGTTLYNK